jgi:hypothetical protein
VNPHLTYPLRRIVRRDVQDGAHVVVLACGHGALGRPASRYSRFYPCRVCHEQVEALRASRDRAA